MESIEIRLNKMDDELKKDSLRFINLYHRLENNNGKIDVNGLSDEDIFVSTVIMLNLCDKAPTSKGFIKYGWSKYKVFAIAKKEKKYISSEPLFSEDTRLICGRGYALNYDMFDIIRAELNRTLLKLEQKLMINNKQS